MWNCFSVIKQLKGSQQLYFLFYIQHAHDTVLCYMYKMERVYESDINWIENVDINLLFVVIVERQFNCLRFYPVKNFY